MDIRVPSDDEREAVASRLLRPAYRDAEARDPEFSAVDDAVAEAEDCSRWLDDDDRTIFVAYDPEPVGTVSGGVSSSPALYERGSNCYIDGLYVVPERRREGIAGDLLDRIADWAESRGCERLSLSVHVDNDTALEFYEDHDFETKFYSLRKRL